MNLLLLGLALIGLLRIAAGGDITQPVLQEERKGTLTRSLFKPCLSMLCSRPFRIRIDKDETKKRIQKTLASIQTRYSGMRF